VAIAAHIGKRNSGPILFVPLPENEPGLKTDETFFRLHE